MTVARSKLKPRHARMRSLLEHVPNEELAIKMEGSHRRNAVAPCHPTHDVIVIILGRADEACLHVHGFGGTKETMCTGFVRAVFMSLRLQFSIQWFPMLKKFNVMR